MAKLLVYEPKDCVKLIKSKYPLIPLWIIRRVLYSEELYMKKIGIIDYNPSLKGWKFKL